MAKVKFHPLCLLYPNVAGQDEERMRESIRADGVREPVTYWKNPDTGEKEFLDGKNRIRLCEELGLPFPSEREYKNPDGGKPTWEDAARFIRAMNARRNIESGALAVLAVRQEKWLEREKKKHTPPPPKGGKKAKPEPAAGAKGGDGEAPANGEASAPKKVDPALELAKKYGSNRQYIYDAQKIETLDRSLGDKVLKGEISLNGAIRQIKGQDANSPPGRRPKDKTQGKPADAPVLDAHGKEVPKSFRRVFEARADFDDALALAKKLRSLLKEIAEGPSAGHLDRAQLDNYQRQTIAALEAARPVEICGHCEGRRTVANGKCEACKAQGYLPAGLAGRQTAGATA